MKLIITESQYRILTEAYSEEEFREKYVELGLVPENQFNKIISEFNKPFYIGWMLKMLSSGFIKYEDAYKFKHYFNVFEKFKQHYPIKDLGQIKTMNNVVEFERKSKDILIKQQDNEQGDVSDKKNLVNTNNIQKLESVGIKYLGMIDGYQSFQVPPEVKDSKESWNTYREILGKCSGRDKGQIVSICTMAGFENFQDYLNRFPGSSYYVFYNMGDPLSPYQIHFESSQYMDKNDDPIILDLNIKFIKFLINKGHLNTNKILFYDRLKFNIKLTDLEEKMINKYDSVMNDFVNGSNISYEGDKLLITNPNYDAIKIYGKKNTWDGKVGILLSGSMLRNFNLNYIPSAGEYLYVKLMSLLEDKYNLWIEDYEDLPRVYGEDFFKW